jgi:hypothetical protein
LIAGVILGVLVGSTPAEPGELPVTIDLTVSSTSPSFESTSSWGWLNPSKYDVWKPIEEDSVELSEARIILNHPVYPVMMRGEWNPQLEATGSVAATDLSAGYEDQLSTDIEVYDLALGQHYGQAGRARVTPWFGATYMRIRELRHRVSEGDSSSDPDESTAKSDLWGVMAGADGVIPLRPGWNVIGTAVIRWARGDRDATLSTDDPQDTTATQSDSRDQVMYGAELGVRWDPVDRLQVTGGWRYRDWTHDDGPASFSGPFVRVGVGF